MTLSKARFSIVIPTHLRSKEVFGCLRAIENCLTNYEEFEVIVVSNVEDDNLMRVVRECSGILRLRYLCVGRVGVNRARNLGAKSADGEIIIFIDDDCRFIDPAFLLKIDRHFKMHSASWGLAGRYEPIGKSTVFGHIYYLKQLAWLIRYSNPKTKQVYRFLGGCVAFKREIFERFCFDDRIVFGGSETSLAIQLNKFGYSFFWDQSLKIGHSYGLTFVDLISKVRRQAKYHKSMPQQAHQVFENQKRNYRQIFEIILSRETKKGYRRLATKMLSWIYDMYYG